MRRTEILATVWVCVDCTFAEHGISEDDDVIPEIDPRSWFADASVEITPGLPWEAHECAEDGAYGPDCECEQRAFSWPPCDRCGSHLGGSRDAFTVWRFLDN